MPQYSVIARPLRDLLKKGEIYLWWRRKICFYVLKILISWKTRPRHLQSRAKVFQILPCFLQEIVLLCHLYTTNFRLSEFSCTVQQLSYEAFLSSVFCYREDDFECLECVWSFIYNIGLSFQHYLLFTQNDETTAAAAKKKKKHCWNE